MSNVSSIAQRVSAICCDIGDVLFYDFPIKLTYSFHMHENISRYHPDPPGLWELWRCAGRQIGSLSRIDPELWAASDTRAWDLVLRRWEDLFQPIRGSHSALKSLSKSPIALVANQPEHILPTLEAVGLGAAVDHIVLDTTCGHAKPQLGIYTYALGRLGLPPHACVMIGDDIDNDVIPAKRLGMMSIWIEPYPYSEEVAVPMVPDRWNNLFRDGRIAKIEAQRERLVALAPDLRPDLCLRSLSESCAYLP